jgi:hypothetical protein
MANIGLNWRAITHVSVCDVRMLIFEAVGVGLLGLLCVTTEVSLHVHFRLYRMCKMQ